MNGNCRKIGAEKITLYAARSDGGNGDFIDRAYYLSEEMAIIGTIGFGIHGADGKVEQRSAVKFDDDTYYLISAKPIAVVTNEQAVRETARKDALAVLTRARRLALGIKEP